MKKGIILLLVLSSLSVGSVLANPTLTSRQQALLRGARSCIGDVYDADWYKGGPPPHPGRSCCADVAYWALKEAGIDLREKVDQAIRRNPRTFPSVRHKDIDYRWVPNLVVFFGKYGQILTNHLDPSNAKLMAHWRPGDFVVVNILQDGGDPRNHIMVVSDRKNELGIPLVIHNVGVGCEEDDLARWPIVGHYRY